MDFRFMGNPWNASSYSHPLYQQSFRRIPVEPVQIQPKATPPSQPMKPKVVSIPVHFVGSHRGRSDSAVKIQKVFRGFLVRINMKKIKAIWEEVKDIERRVLKKETVDLIRNNDSRERLKVNEMLMSLLFKLDSIRGVDSGVRDCRKFVIKKAIALQELVDAISSGDQPLDFDNANKVADIKTEGIDQNQAITDSADDCNWNPEESQNPDETTTDNAEFTPKLSESDVTPQNQETSQPSEEVIVADQRQGDEVNIETDRTESQTDSSANPETLVEDKEEEAAPAPASAPASDENVKERNNKEKEDGVEWESKGGKELLERLMADNEKMMELMAELFETNEKQTRLMSALTQRVEQLEKAFLCKKLRRKKKRCAATAGTVDCVEKSPDVKKCEKR